MSSSQHFLLISVVDAGDWQTNRAEWLESARATLHRRAEQRGLAITTEPVPTVEVLPGATRLRVTVQADGDPVG